MKPAHLAGASLLAVSAASALGVLLLSDAAPTAPVATPEPTTRAARATTSERSAPRVVLSDAQRIAAATPADDAPPVPTLLDLRVGDVREATFRHDSRLALGEEAQQVEVMATVVEGRLTVTCYAADERELLLGQRWAASSVTLEGQEGVSRDALARDLAAELLVRVDRRGRVLELALPTRASTEARNLARALMGAVSLVLPERAAPRWQADGLDPIGPCVDDYAVREVGEAAVVVDRARRFSSVHGGAEAGFEATVEGGLELTIAADGLASRVRGREVVRLGSAGASVGMRLLTTTSIERTGARALSAEEARRALTAAEAALGASAWSVGLAPEVGADGARVARREPRELEALLPLLVQAFPEAGELEVAADAPALFLELAERFRRDPAALERSADLVRGAALPQGARATLIDAMGEAGTTLAQRTLVELARDARVQDDVTPNVFLSLAEPIAPLPEVVATLEAVAAGRDALRAEWAAQGLGILAGRADDPVLADRLAAGLERGLGESGESDRVLLEALGNAGRERSAEAIVGYTKAQDEELRATAVSALRNLDGEHAQAAIGRALEDESDLVRREALRVLAARGPAAALGAVVEALQRDPESVVRLDALEVLAAWLDDATQDPTAATVPADTLRGLVQQTAQRDPAPEVREAAVATLGGA